MRALGGRGAALWRAVRAWACVCVALSPVRPGAGAGPPWLVPNLEDLVPDTLEMPPQYIVKDGDEFEYVVVGAGAGGAALASRLALAGRSALLVEAGGDPGLLSMIPAAAMGLLGSPIDWQYETIPNNVSCLSSEGQQCRFSRGKCLGGSTSINYMLYVRGNRADYELGLPGWSWADLEPYFLRYEGLQVLDELPASSIPYHNTSGIMQIEFFTDSGNSWHSRIVEGLQSLNFPFNRDVNGESQIGVTQSIGYVYKGERMGTARGYLSRDEVKKRLKVAKNTRCTGVIIDEDNVARGVTVALSPGGPELRVRATREVVLSAGALGTPQLLQLSGVGPAPHLAARGVPLRRDLPVGDNMSDHVLPLMFVLVDQSLLALGVDALSAVGDATLYGLTRNGPFASNGLTDVIGFANTSCYDTETRQLNNGSGCELPTLQLISAYIDRGLVSIGGPIFKQSTMLSDDLIAQLAEVNTKAAIIITSPVVLHPYSRGSVRLASADAWAPPAIFPNYLSDDRDVEEMLRSIALLEQLVQTPAYRRHGAVLMRPRLSGCPAARAQGYWECYVRHVTYSVFHAAGTAALGPVLDERLRVRGVARLRVADLSALPVVPRGNTAAVAIAIGERAADFMMEDEDEDN